MHTRQDFFCFWRRDVVVLIVAEFDEIFYQAMVQSAKSRSDDSFFSTSLISLHEKNDGALPEVKKKIWSDLHSLIFPFGETYFLDQRVVVAKLVLIWHACRK